jgi:hypothetical protein
MAPHSLLDRQVVLLEFLQRRSVSDSIYSSPYFLGIIFGSGLWIAYAWVTRLRYGARLRHHSEVSFSFTRRIYWTAGLGAHYDPYIHALFGLLFGSLRGRARFHYSL